jgi:hypothetical protein
LWRDVLIPALAELPALALWPHDGALAELLVRSPIVFAEGYPAEARLRCPELRGQGGGSKRDAGFRASCGAALQQWAQRLGVELTRAAHDAAVSGFGGGPLGEDAFDAFCGALGALEVVLGHRPEGAPRDMPHLGVEGWILGLDPADLIDSSGDER